MGLGLWAADFFQQVVGLVDFEYGREGVITHSRLYGQHDGKLGGIFLRLDCFIYQVTASTIHL